MMPIIIAPPGSGKTSVTRRWTNTYDSDAIQDAIHGAHSLSAWLLLEQAKRDEVITAVLDASRTGVVLTNLIMDEWPAPTRFNYTYEGYRTRIRDEIAKTRHDLDKWTDAVIYSRWQAYEHENVLRLHGNLADHAVVKAILAKHCVPRE